MLIRLTLFALFAAATAGGVAAQTRFSFALDAPAAHYSFWQMEDVGMATTIEADLEMETVRPPQEHWLPGFQIRLQNGEESLALWFVQAQGQSSMDTTLQRFTGDRLAWKQPLADWRPRPGDRFKLRLDWSGSGFLLLSRDGVELARQPLDFAPKTVAVSASSGGWMAHGFVLGGSPMAVPVTGSDAQPSIPEGASAVTLVEETQRHSRHPNIADIVWWIPHEFWELSARASNMPQQGIEEILGVLSRYTLVAIARGTTGPFGGVEWESEQALRKTVRIVDRMGREYEPMSSSALSGDAANLVQFVKTLMAGLAGQFGENVHFFYFPASAPEGYRIADPRSEGTFLVKVAGDVHRWRLPLGSLLTGKHCPVDREPLSGAWSFCPVHGSPLTR